jgi:hypothetical protein
MPSSNSQSYSQQAQKIERLLIELPSDHPLRTLLVESAQLLSQAADGRCQDSAPDNTLVAQIDKGYHWREIDSHTPRGSKMQLIHRWSGVAIYGTISSHEKFFTHWAPLPTFLDKGPRR